MLSICGSIYANSNIVPFVRSVLDNTTKPDEIEFSVVEDECGSDLMAGCFEQIRAMTKNLKVVGVPREERIAAWAKCIEFYRREDIFPPEVVAECKARLALYEQRKLQRLWLTPSRNQNMAMAASSGDVILQGPLDMLVEFDLVQIYERFKEALPSYKSSLCVLFGVRGHNEVQMHGIRMFNRAVFRDIEKRDPKFSDEPWSFDPRWFILSHYEDDWNSRAALRTGRSVVGWALKFGDKPVFLMPKREPWLRDDLYTKGNFTFLFWCVRKYIINNKLEQYPSYMTAVKTSDGYLYEYQPFAGDVDEVPESGLC